VAFENCGFVLHKSASAVNFQESDFLKPSCNTPRLAATNDKADLIQIQRHPNSPIGNVPASEDADRNPSRGTDAMPCRHRIPTANHPFPSAAPVAAAPASLESSAAWIKPSFWFVLLVPPKPNLHAFHCKV
jgi:hypothetical protein